MDAYLARIVAGTSAVIVRESLISVLAVGIAVGGSGDAKILG